MIRRHYFLLWTSCDFNSVFLTASSRVDLTTYSSVPNKMWRHAYLFWKKKSSNIHFSPNKFRNFPNHMNFSPTKWKKNTTTTLIPTNTLIWYTRVQSLIWDLCAALKCSKRQTAQNIALTIWVNLSLIFAIFPSSNSRLQSEASIIYWNIDIYKVSLLKYGFHNKSFILNAPLVSCPIPVIRFGWVQQQTHPKRMTGIGQLTRGALLE